MSDLARILVVDDTPQNVKLLADLLTVKGYAVVTAASPRRRETSRQSSIARW